MGYQVGNVCYLDRESAENVYFSLVPPVITNDGFKQLSHTSKGWYYGSQKIQANLPICDPAQNVLLGFELAASLIPTALLLTFTLVLIRLFR